MKKALVGLIVGFILAPYLLFGVSQIGYFDSLISSAGKTFTYSNTLTLSGTDSAAAKSWLGWSVPSNTI